jgi:lipoprotein-anchoring transpeptidase ErfK/SrfK
MITLASHELEVLDSQGKVIARFPVSIARMAEKRPVGTLHVTVSIMSPNYTFEPDQFPESEEGKALGRKLILPPGPNNPVGMVWIGLDRPGYGIHGTPEPENVGRTESHGCFRLANWDALTLMKLVQVGMVVNVL